MCQLVRCKLSQVVLHLRPSLPRKVSLTWRNLGHFPLCFFFPEHEEKLFPEVAAGEHVREEVHRVVQTRQKSLKIRRHGYLLQKM